MAANHASSPPPSPGPHIRPHLSLSSPDSPRPFFVAKSQQATDFPSVVAALQHCSELRTRMEDTVAAMTNQGLDGNGERECSCPPEPTVLPLDCEDCIHECDIPHCDVGLSSECTDQCVVVACNDSHHAASPRDGSLFPDPCNIPCENGLDCTGLEEFFQCCPEYHGYLPDSKSYGSDMTPPHPDIVWDPALAAFLCGCTESQVANFTGGYPNMSTTNSTSSTPQLTPSPVTFHTQAQHLLQPAGLPIQNHSQLSQMSNDVNQLYAQQPSRSPQPQFLPHRCQWGGCFASFGTLTELAGHVNLQHLRPAATNPGAAAPPPVHSPQQGPSAVNVTTSGLSLDGLSCMWADCQLYPSPQSIPGSSTGTTFDSALDVLASHLLEDHLGLPLRSQKPEQTPQGAQNVDIQAPVPAPAAPGVASDALSSTYSPPTPLPEHDCAASPVHVCRWEGCMASYPTCNELTAHITAEHVGSGKAHYECRWEGCARHGEKGFSSKQKILRHLQSHTGHRPFQCEICGQFFSEAATLAQHKRRHTQEKPYVCDFPGCGKSFAITGALTIHKRTHNGHKPFKCSYCDRTFAESSNLSKHLRTHTGARPYPCMEPGCNKSFARPDQLTRHQNVHRKKSVESETAA